MWHEFGLIPLLTSKGGCYGLCARSWPAQGHWDAAATSPSTGDQLVSVPSPSGGFKGSWWRVLRGDAVLPGSHTAGTLLGHARHRLGDGVTWGQQLLQTRSSCSHHRAVSSAPRWNPCPVGGFNGTLRVSLGSAGLGWHRCHHSGSQELTGKLRHSWQQGPAGEPVAHPRLGKGDRGAVSPENALRSLLEALTSPPYAPTQHLEREQALAKQFAEILHFTLSFDELKMTNPAIQNDFSYYRRTISRNRINNLQLDAESEVNNEMANRMSLFYAEATPMLKTLSNATTKFVSENKTLPIEDTTDCLSTMACVCRVMLETPEYRSRFTNTETLLFCMRVMVGVIILYDHVHPVGAFAKTSKIDVSGFGVTKLRGLRNKI
uniref:CYRIA/CYRIB Rac1 binding domain-containing protein n=1 Tax=Junco hyemalis TaxID=40217 RepID=A0A8C5JFD2_JUNHY